MNFNVKKVPIFGNDLSRGLGKLAGAPTQQRNQPQFLITDIGRKRLHSMENMSGPELQVLQVLAVRNHPISAWEILNATQGQIDTPTLKVALSELRGKHCIQNIEGA